MRKNVKESLIDIIPTILDAHEIALKYAKSGEIDLVMSVFTECQEAMVKIGEVIEENEGENHKTIEFLQSYCDELYEVSLVIAENSEPNFNKLFKRIALKLKDVLYSIKNDIKVKQEIVFMPYKASMWDALESVWKAADEDPDCDAYVVPIPYYDRKNDFSFGEMHYEGEDFPDYVPITHYNAYNLGTRRPDAIYIHNPYDECNYVTSVDPRFYSSKLKEYTECLVYIPYFVLEEPNPNDPLAIKNVSHFATTPGVINAHKVIVQSEAMREVYIKALLEKYGDTPELRNYFESKIFGTGSPKFDKVCNTTKDDIKIPDEWLKVIQKEDGSYKKVVLYNLGVTDFLKYGEKIFEIADNDFNNLTKKHNEVVILLRPHPLLENTVASMSPALIQKYYAYIEKYREHKFLIYDDSPNLDRAIHLSDFFAGCGSSIKEIFRVAKKQILPLSCDMSFDAICDDEEFYWFTTRTFNGLFKMDKNTNAITLETFFPESNVDDKRMYAGIVSVGEKLFFAPLRSNVFLSYDKINHRFKKIETIPQKFFGENNEYKFFNMFRNNNYIYLIPLSFNGICRYNLETGETTVFDDYLKEFYSFSEANVLMSRSVLVDDKLYIASSVNNSLLLINLPNMSYEIITLGDTNDSFVAICECNNIIYLCTRKNPKIISYDIKSHEEKIYNLPQEDDEFDFKYSNIQVVNNCVIAFPYNSHKCYYIDLYADEILEYNEELTGITSVTQFNGRIIISNESTGKITICNSSGEIVEQKTLDYNLHEAVSLLKQGEYDDSEKIINVGVVIYNKVRRG